MTYKVLKSLVYGGKAYAEGQEVDIIEKTVAENCLERELIAEITDTEVVETGETEVTGEIDGTEETENNEDAAEEAVSSEENTEEVVSSETDEETTEEQKKNNKRNKNNK